MGAKWFISAHTSRLRPTWLTCYTHQVDIISLPLIFTTSFVVNLSGALSPGPLLVVTISEAAKRGFWAGPILVLGHMIPEIVVVVALTKGMSKLMESDLVTNIVWLVGGVVLIGMGAIISVKGRGASFTTSGQQTPRKSRALVLSGILTTISNPYWFVWWAVIGAAYVVWSLNMGILGVISFFSGHIMADLAWYSVISAAVASGRRIMNDRIYRGLMIGCGIIIIAMGGYFAVSGFRLLTG